MLIFPLGCLTPGICSAYDVESVIPKYNYTYSLIITGLEITGEIPGHDCFDIMRPSLLIQAFGAEATAPGIIPRTVLYLVIPVFHSTHNQVLAVLR